MLRHDDILLYSHDGGAIVASPRKLASNSVTAVQARIHPEKRMASVRQFWSPPG